MAGQWLVWGGSNNKSKGPGGLRQSPEMLLLSRQLAASMDFSPLTKIHQAAVLAHCFYFSMVARRGTSTLRIHTATGGSGGRMV